MLAQDSIHSEIVAPVVVHDSAISHPAMPRTPYQVLRSLPKDATPAQQDSAIQAWFQPGEIRYSEQPDTLHLPGQAIPRDLKEVNLPQYYRENFFSKDTLYHPELDGGRIGVAGDPIPYVIRNDNVITGLLIICFLVYILTISRISEFFVYQVKNFLNPTKATQDFTETGTEVKFQLVYLAITSLIYALLYHLYVTRTITDTFIFSSEYTLLGIFCLIMISYFAMKALLYTTVNSIFFNKKKNLQFLRDLLFINSLEGVLTFPLVLLLAYFDFSIQNAIIYCIIILAFAKILTFYKSYVIFFKQKGLYLQIILYFCALEMIPLVLLWEGLLEITNILKVNI